MGQFGWVSVFRKIAFALCSLKAATQCKFGRRPSRSHFLPNGRISARQRTLHHEASCWNPWITSHPGRAEEYFFDHIPRLGCRQSFAKSGVKTWSVDAHSPCEIGKRCAFVTFGPKNVHRAIQGRVRIEGARPAELCMGF